MKGLRIAALAIVVLASGAYGAAKHFGLIDYIRTMSAIGGGGPPR